VIGLVGGTFDPVHVGHLDIAAAAEAALGLDRVVFIPAKHPPHRDTPAASGADRLAMLDLAIAGRPNWETSSIELDADGPSYTDVTLARWIERSSPAPAAGATADLGLCFVVGADAFAGIGGWHRYPSFFDRCHFAVVSRPGVSALDAPARLPALARRMVVAKHQYQTPTEPCIFLIDARTAPVSSTDVRASIDRGASLAGMVPDAVAAYIDSHRLYRREAHGH
jgi:nicotinate-nucleotide adenylyltransferase